MMFVLERRANPSVTMAIASPLLAAAGMIATGFFLFTALGKDPVEVFYLFFIKPLSTTYDIGELLLKTTPLLLCERADGPQPKLDCDAGGGMSVVVGRLRPCPLLCDKLHIVFLFGG